MPNRLSLGIDTSYDVIWVALVDEAGRLLEDRRRPLPVAPGAGGVASNGILRERLREKLEHRAVGARLAFAQPQFSSDTAVGTAVLARANHRLDS